jgi:hypothetical protein
VTSSARTEHTAVARARPVHRNETYATPPDTAVTLAREDGRSMGYSKLWVLASALALAASNLLASRAVEREVQA